MVSIVKPIESFFVLRRQETVDNTGQSQISVIRIPATGSIAPSGDKTLNRDENYQTQINKITIITTFKFRAPTEDARARNYQSDIVEWNGEHYLIMTLNEFIGSSESMTIADLESVDLTDLPPE